MVFRATLAVCMAKAAPSFLSYFKTLSIGPVPGIKPTTSHSAVKHYALPTERILLQLRSRIFNIVSCTCYYLASSKTHPKGKPHLKRATHYYGQFVLSHGKESPVCFSNFTPLIHRGYYMAAWRYKISLRVLKKISRMSAANE